MPDDMADLAAIRHELSDLNRQFNNMLIHHDTVSDCCPQPTMLLLSQLILVNHKWPQQLVSQPAASPDSADDVYYFSAVVKANCSSSSSGSSSTRNEYYLGGIHCNSRCYLCPSQLCIMCP